MSRISSSWGQARWRTARSSDRNTCTNNMEALGCGQAVLALLLAQREHRAVARGARTPTRAGAPRRAVRQNGSRHELHRSLPLRVVRWPAPAGRDRPRAGDRAPGHRPRRANDGIGRSGSSPRRPCARTAKAGARRRISSITYDLALLSSIASRVAVLYRGRPRRARTNPLGLRVGTPPLHAASALTGRRRCRGEPQAVPAGRRARHP